MSVNVITSVRVAEKSFNVETLSYSRAWVTELKGDAIITYRRQIGEKKQLDKSVIRVDEQTMKDFFAQLYDFARTAEFSETPIDDCSHKVTFYYDGYHKEIFEGMTYKGSDTLIGMIDRFVEKY